MKFKSCKVGTLNWSLQEPFPSAVLTRRLRANIINTIHTRLEQLMVLGISIFILGYSKDRLLVVSVENVCMNIGGEWCCDVPMWGCENT